MKLRDNTVTIFRYKYDKKIIFSGEITTSMPNLRNEYSRENYTQLANLCNIEVKQEFELIMLDIKAIYVNIFMYEPIKIMA